MSTRRIAGMMGALVLLAPGLSRATGDNPASGPAPAAAGFTEAPIRLDPGQQQLIGVTYGVVERKAVEKVVRTVARFDYDERKVAEVTMKVPGYIQDLYVDYTGRPVRKGEPLFSIYSPDLVTAQQEYLIALDGERRLHESEVPGAHESAAALVRASRERLRLWDLSDQDVHALETSRQPKLYAVVHSPSSGYVIEKTAVRGRAVEPGTTLYRIADLSSIWVYADIYEYELPFVRVGQEGTITTNSYPGASFTARVDYVYPTIDPKTRTARVRFELANSPDRVLRPEMYGNVELHVALGERLVVPKTAVLDTGTRQVVFVDGGNGRLVPRDVRVGERFAQTVEVTQGLSEGERVVTSGNFLVDSESKLQATESMMGMMGAIGMADWKMESAKPMDMGGGNAAPQPAPNAPPPTTETVAQEKRVGDLLVAVTPGAEPTTKGQTSIRVSVRDPGGAPVSGATVSFTYTMDMAGMRIEESGTKSLGNGVYEGMATFTMAGPWGVVVQIERPGTSALREKFIIRVGG
jgi:Cu(I)/Ag(I) efflux system membrane fusion protein